MERNGAKPHTFSVLSLCIFTICQQHRTTHLTYDYANGPRRTNCRLVVVDVGTATLHLYVYSIEWVRTSEMAHTHTRARNPK